MVCPSAIEGWQLRRVRTQAKYSNRVRPVGFLRPLPPLRRITGIGVRPAPCRRRARPARNPNASGAGVVAMSHAHPAPAVPAEPRLTSLLVMSEHDGNPGVEYVIGGVNLAGPEREQAAQLLADDAMRIRCGRSPVLGRWRARRDGGSLLSGAAAEAVRDLRRDRLWAAGRRRGECRPPAGARRGAVVEPGYPGKSAVPRQASACPCALRQT